jgi:hypothetical protein
MLPAYWPVLVAGIAIAAAGIVLLLRARTIASIVARRVEGASPGLSAVFLIRKRPDSEAGTVRYLSDIYRVVGLLWAALGALLVYVVFFAKPPH